MKAKFGGNPLLLKIKMDENCQTALFSSVVNYTETKGQTGLTFQTMLNSIIINF